MGWTRNPLGSARAGSNPAVVDFFPSVFSFYQNTFSSTWYSLSISFFIHLQPHQLYSTIRILIFNTINSFWSNMSTENEKHAVEEIIDSFSLQAMSTLSQINRNFFSYADEHYYSEKRDVLLPFFDILDPISRRSKRSTICLIAAQVSPKRTKRSIPWNGY